MLWILTSRGNQTFLIQASHIGQLPPWKQETLWHLPRAARKARCIRIVTRKLSFYEWYWRQCAQARAEGITWKHGGGFWKSHLNHCYHDNHERQEALGKYLKSSALSSNEWGTPPPLSVVQANGMLALKGKKNPDDLGHVQKTVDQTICRSYQGPSEHVSSSVGLCDAYSVTKGKQQTLFLYQQKSKH